MFEFHLSPGWTASLVVSAVISLSLPVILAIAARRRLGGRWRILGWGALVFTVSQILTRIPAIQILGWWWQDALKASQTLQWLWLTALCFSAGLFEEGGRYLGYRWLLRKEPKDLSTGVLFGIGHGGFEAMVLVGLGQLTTLVSLYFLQETGLAMIPAEAREITEKQLITIMEQPDWVPLLAAWERVASMAIHVSLSLIVLLAVRSGQWRWLLVAMLYHGASNFVAVGYLELAGRDTVSMVVTEVLITLIAAAGLWFALSRTVRLTKPADGALNDPPTRPDPEAR